MSTDTPATPPPSPRKRRKQEKKSLWQMDISSIGKKDPLNDDTPIERAPFVPTLPQVNLLPQSVLDSTAVARTVKWAVVAVGVVLLSAGALWWLQGSTIDKAQSDLAAAKQQNTTLQGQVAALAPVKQMYEQITRLQGVVTSTLAAQPQAAVVIDRLVQAGDQVTGPAITMTNTDVTYNGIPQPGDPLSQCPNPDPFGEEITIGCLTFAATAEDRDQVSQLLRLLDEDPLFVGPYVTSTTATEVLSGPNGNNRRSVVAFSGSAGISIEALQTLLTQEQIEEILTPPEPTPSPSASAEGEQE